MKKKRDSSRSLSGKKENQNQNYNYNYKSPFECYRQGMCRSPNYDLNVYPNYGQRKPQEPNNVPNHYQPQQYQSPWQPTNFQKQQGQTINSLCQSINQLQNIQAKVVNVQFDCGDNQVLQNKIIELQRLLQEKEQQLNQQSSYVQTKEKENREQLESTKQLCATEIKKSQLQLEELKKQLKEKSDIIERLKCEMQQREKKINDSLEVMKRCYEEQKQKVQEELLKVSSKDNEIIGLHSDVQVKQNELKAAYSQVEKLQHNIDQLVCKVNEQNSDESIIKISNNLNWNQISQAILKTQFSCVQCHTILNNLINNYFEQIIKEIQEKKIAQNLETIKLNLLLNHKVKLCSAKNCTFFCIWQSNLQNLSSNQGYCQLCSKQSIFLEAINM